MNDYEIIPNRDERCWDLYDSEDWHSSWGSRTDAEAERDRLEAEDEEARAEASWQTQDRERNQ